MNELKNGNVLFIYNNFGCIAGQDYKTAFSFFTYAFLVPHNGFDSIKSKIKGGRDFKMHFWWYKIGSFF